MKISELEMLLESAKNLEVENIYFSESRDGTKSLTTIHGAELEYKDEIDSEIILVLR